jgi:hypothetical protein
MKCMRVRPSLRWARRIHRSEWLYMHSRSTALPSDGFEKHGLGDEFEKRP